MTSVAVYAGGELDEVATGYDIVVGVDAGALFVLDHRLPLDVAIGDFDSVSAEAFQQIERLAGEVIVLPSEKNDTDLEYALKQVFQHYPDAQVSVFGALGGRLDHTLSSVFLASEPDLSPFMEQIRLLSRDNVVAYFAAGEHEVAPVEGMEYVAFMPSDGARLSITGAKYPLSSEHYFFKKCYSSNEFIDETLNISLDSGYVVVIYSKDRS